MRKYIVLFFLLVSTALAGGFLRQSTAVTIPAGPFIDDTDGQTLLASVTVTGISLTITKADGVTVEVAALAASGTANDLVMTTTTTNDCMGYQELQATDLSVVGELTVVWYDADQIYPIKQTYTVLPAASYDVLFVTAPGASNGLFIAGTNTGNVVISPTAGVPMTLTAGTGDSSGLVITGTDAGHGIIATGGANDGVGIYAYGQGAGAGLEGRGGSTGPGIYGVGGGNNAAATGMTLNRGGTSADDLKLVNGDFTLPTMPADWMTASGLKADAVTEIAAGIASDSTWLAALAAYLNRSCMGI